DGIRDRNVTGVQTCALPISSRCSSASRRWESPPLPAPQRTNPGAVESNRLLRWWGRRFGVRLQRHLATPIGQLVFRVFYRFAVLDRKSTRLNSSLVSISYAV